MDTAKACEFVEKSHHLALLLPPEPNLDCLASAEALIWTLEKREKQIGLFSGVARQHLPQPEFFPKLTVSPTLPKEFVISLNTASSPVSQLRYEKTEERIDIIFSPQGNLISPQAVSFREGKMLCDGAIAIGIADLESLPGLTPQFLSDIPILNIGLAGESKNYGEVNLVSPEKSSLAEITYDLITALNQDPLPPSSATLLLGAILRETNHFTTRTSADTLMTSSELMRLGAELARAQELTKEAKAPQLTQLLGRATVRSRLEKGVLWSFLTAEDFEKTGRTAQDINQVLSHLDQEFPPRKVAALLWHNPEDNMVKATLAGEKRILETIAARGAGKFQSAHLQISAPFGSFREAEEILTSLLDGVL